MKIKFLSGNSFKRLDIKGLLSDPQWKNYLYKIHPKNLAVLLDSMQVRNMGFPLRVAMLSLVISENGGHTTPHGNGAYGLIGWRGDRAAGLGKTVQELTHKLMNEIHNNNQSKVWTHGGKGTGVKTGKEMLKLYRTTPNSILATKALMKGYVRPPVDSMLKRINLTNLLIKYMK